jgi:hypothetical protein
VLLEVIVFLTQLHQMAVVVVELMIVDREQMEVLVVAAWVVEQPVLEIHRQHLHHREIMVEPEILFHRDVHAVEVAVEQMR